MAFKKIFLIPIIVGIVLIFARQLFIQSLLSRDFEIFGFVLRSLYVVVMVAIPVSFARKLHLGKKISEFSITHSIGFSLLIFIVYLVLFFSRLIIMIDLFAQKPIYLVVEFVMMVSILIALCLPFMIRLKKAELAQQA